MVDRVGVIIPTQNRPTMTAEAVQSVVEQTFSDWQLVIVDDGSTDDNRDALRAALVDDPRVSIVETGGPVGPRRARQVGFDALGDPDFVAILDSDDVWLPEKLQVQTLLAENDIEAGAVTCGHVWERADGTVRATRLGRSGTSPLLTNNMSTPLFRSEALCAAGGLAPVGLPALRTCENTEFWVRFMTAGNRVVAAEKPLVRCREHRGERESSELGSTTAADDLAWVLDRYRSAMRRHADDLTRLEWQVGMRYLAAGRRSKGLRHAGRALMSRPGPQHRAMLREVPFAVRALANGTSGTGRS